MFRTIVEIKPSQLKIGYEDSIMTLGSCFAENIGLKMSNLYFDINTNPFGVLYNPVSILKSIELLMQNNLFTKNDLFTNRGLWQSFSFSSLFSDVNQEKCLEKLNSSFSNAASSLQKTDYILITFGTAWIYEEKSSGSVVSNCHKLPANRFVRRRLTTEEIVADYSNLIQRFQELYPHTKFIFSVSPIRHWKDGAHENNISKSTLLLAIEMLEKKFNNVEYFPAYEIMMDELRDYRFYASDMLHPSEVAVDYIWKRFCETFFDEMTMKMKEEFEQLKNNLSHRPLFPESDEYQTFKINLEKLKEILKSRYHFMSNRID